MFRSKQYILELGGAFVLYAILLVGANAVERAVQPVGNLKLVINLVPMIGAAAAAWAILRGLWRMDEMQRRIQLDAIAISFRHRPHHVRVGICGRGWIAAPAGILGVADHGDIVGGWAWSSLSAATSEQSDQGTASRS